MIPSPRCLLLLMSGWISANSYSQKIELANAFTNLIFTKPLFLTHSNNGTNRIFVVQQNGLIKVFPNDSAVTSAATFLDLTTKISSSSGEEGLLGLAFDPDYRTNGYFYVNYTAPAPLRTVIARYTVMVHDPTRADPLSELKILEITQPFPNHNGGMILFGTDAYLYIGMGDGGSGGDPQRNGQNLSNLLGKILRINVDSITATTNYTIPSDNPFKGNLEGHREEIWAYGFRNPWRFSQDPLTREMWAGDVGQNAWEEIDLVLKGGNYGWRIMEGAHCFDPPTGCNRTGLTLPVKEYPNTGSDCSATGGYLYRGWRRPDLYGAYVYGDFCSGMIWMFRYQNGQVTSDSLIFDAPFSISSFGVDQEGELYICNYSGGNIQRFAGNPVTKVDRGKSNIPGSFELDQNYPNPFNPLTRIQYSLPKNIHAILTVHDLLGREITTLIDEIQEAGHHSMEFDARNISSGIFFYRLKAGPFVETKKMVHLK